MGTILERVAIEKAVRNPHLGCSAQYLTGAGASDVAVTAPTQTAVSEITVRADDRPAG